MRVQRVMQSMFGRSVVRENSHDALYQRVEVRLKSIVEGRNFFFVSIELLISLKECNLMIFPHITSHDHRLKFNSSFAAARERKIPMHKNAL